MNANKNEALEVCEQIHFYFLFIEYRKMKSNGKERKMRQFSVLLVNQSLLLRIKR